MAHRAKAPKRHKVKEHERRPPTRKPPMPGQNEFSPTQETAMRAGRRQPPMMPPGDGDADDMGGMGGL